MKKHILTLLFISTVFFAYAQPSKSALLAKIKSIHSKNLISAKLVGNGISERVYEDGAWRYYYRHSYTIVQKTQYQGITIVYSGGIQYIKSGGYVYSKLLVGDSYYKGVPNPDKAVILKMVKDDLLNFVRLSNYNRIVGKVTDIGFPADPKWYWRKLTQVDCLMKATFSVPVSYTELEKGVHFFRVSLVSDKYKSPWVRFVSIEESKLKKPISVSKHTADQIRAMKTLHDIDEENKAKAVMSSLPDVGEIPKFESDKQLFYFMHDVFLTKSANEVKAYLYKTMNKDRCFTEKSNVVMNSGTQEWFDQLTNNLDAYKGAHCQYPSVKHQQTGQIEFYDKENRRILRFTGSKTGDTWTLNEVSFYPAKASELTRMKNNNANCQEKPNLTVRKVVAYNIGDKINAKFSNGTFPAYIDKKDPNFSNRYFIKLENDNSGKGYWMTEDFFTPRTGGATTNTQNNNNVNTNTNTNKKQVSFKVGDKVQVQTRTKGWLDGEIIKYASHKYLIKFKKNYKDMWVPPTQLRLKQ